ncbi:Tetratricopeptide repeat protein 25 [Cichlidogyrus casuarinus]|uniref:Outer dynein arm-docking complex subunit 4 n=1 Tax=Cichlidogyrus casuarinus TaxID=1844966 RepID=A0ABD2QBR0_9PLAT
MANIYALEGNSYFELGQLDQAMLCHEADLCIATELNLPEAKSRAQDNIGRTYAKQKKYAKAIEIWEERLPTIKTDLESTWLNHELGRCYLELGDTEKAIYYGNLSLAKAEVIKDKTWKLNANVLVAQAHLKKDELKEALDSFEAAEVFAEELNNRAASRAINKAIESLKMKIDLGIDDISKGTIYFAGLNSQL